MKTIKKYGRVITPVLILVMLSIFAYVAKIAMAAPVDTYHSKWEQVKDSASEDGATFAASLALDTNEGNFANILSDAFHIRSYGMPQTTGNPVSGGGAWQFAFFGTDAANETFSFTMVGWSRVNGMAQVICEGDGILGTQDVVIEPNGDAITNGLWADTLSLDETTKWPSVGVYNASGDNECSILAVDLTGLEYVAFITYDVSGGAEAATIGVYGRSY